MLQTSINAPRQKTQAMIKQACQKAGIEVELKSVVGSVFFSSNTANPDTYPHFYYNARCIRHYSAARSADLHEPVLSWEVATKENKWQGRNVARWQNKEYDKMYSQAEQELDR